MTGKFTGTSEQTRRYRDIYGPCIVDGCLDSRTKWSLVCINHTYEDLPDLVELIYEYDIKCLMCSYSKPAHGTKDQEKATRLLMRQKCPDCNGILVIEETGRVVGRRRKGAEHE
jgi:hypothetical protein